MVARLDAAVFDRQRQPRLVAEDRLMLRAVVLEHAVDVLLLGAQDHVSEEDHELDDGFDQIVHRRALDIRVDKAGQKRRQQEKEQDRQPQRQKDRQRRDEFLFLANDAGSNVTKKTTDKCNYYNIEVSTVFNALELSMAIGKPRKTVAVVDAGFSKKMRTLMD